MDELEFKRLIEKYQQGELSGEEKKLMDEWFDAIGRDNAQNTADTNWTNDDKLNLKKKILAQIKVEEQRPAVAEDLHFLRRITIGPKVWYRAAASVLLAALSFTLWQYSGTKLSFLFSREKVTAVATKGHIKKVNLSDGSIVWLKGNSTLTYHEEFKENERYVTLQGEALFEVEKDPAHPFVIQCGDLTTTVLGTSFNIKSNEKNIEVVVFTGKVSLTSLHNKLGIIVLPNEKVIYNGEHKHLAKAEVVMEEKNATIAGTEYSMDFNDTRMSEIIRRIEGKFNVKVTLSDPMLGNCVITADFTDQSLGRTLNLISQAIGFEYETDGKVILLRGTGCEPSGTERK